MPGLNKIKQFYENIYTLGDELTVRRSRGDIIDQLAIPEGISEADDSEDFLYGIPVEQSAEEKTAEEAKKAESEESKNIDINALLNENIGGETETPSPDTAPAPSKPAAEPDFDVDAFLKENLGAIPGADAIPVPPPAPEPQTPVPEPAPAPEASAQSVDDLQMPEFDFG